MDDDQKQSLSVPVMERSTPGRADERSWRRTNTVISCQLFCLAALSILLTVTSSGNVLVSAARPILRTTADGSTRDRIHKEVGSWWGRALRRRKQRTQMDGTENRSNPLVGDSLELSEGDDQTVVEPPLTVTSAEVEGTDKIFEEERIKTSRSGFEISVKTSNEQLSSSENNTTELDDEWRRSLPPTLRTRSTLHRLLIPVSALDDEHVNSGSISSGTLGGGTQRQQQQQQQQQHVEVYLLGTSHISKSSCADVRVLMEHIQPDCLFIELCPQRVALLEPPPETVEVGKVDDKTAESISTQAKQIQQSQGLSRTGALGAVLLSKIQGDYASKLNVTIGGEFREAYNAALEQNRRRNVRDFSNLLDNNPGCVVILGDRPLRLTLLRAWESLSVIGKIKLIIGLLWSSIRQPSDKEILEWMDSIMNGENDLLTESIAELSRHFPSVGRVVIDERDLYMAGKLMQTARLLATGNGYTRPRSVVAVVGAGHCPGICRLLSGSEKEFGRSQKFASLEDALRSVVETKRWKVEVNEEVRSLVTDVTELHTR